MGCTTHHGACDCREAAIAELIKAKDREIRALKFEIGILRAEVERHKSTIAAFEVHLHAAQRRGGE